MTTRQILEQEIKDLQRAINAVEFAMDNVVYSDEQLQAVNTSCAMLVTIQNDKKRDLKRLI